MRKNKTRRWIGMAVTLIACMPAGAGEPKDEIRKVLSVWGGDRALMLIRLDLARMDMDAAYDLGERTLSKSLAPEAAGQMRAACQATRKTAKEAVASLQAAGAKTVYAVWSDTDQFDPVLAIPASAGANEAVLKQGVQTFLKGLCVETLLKGLYSGDEDWLQVRKVDSILLMRCRPGLDQYKAPSGPPGHEWDQAIARVTDAAVQVFLAPSGDSRRVLEDMLPVVSGQRVQVPDHAITRGLLWATLSLDWPPKLALRVCVQSADPASAQALGQLMASVTQSLGLKTPDPKQGSAPVGLTPEVVDNTLRLNLDAEQSTVLFADDLAPALTEAQRRIARFRCARSLCDLGRAMILYASDHSDLLPPDLQILTKTSQTPARVLRCEGEAMGGSAMPYVYRGVDVVLGKVSANSLLILVHDPRGSHHDGRNVLFVDSRVEWATEDQFQKLIDADNRLRRQAGLPEKPAD